MQSDELTGTFYDILQDRIAGSMTGLQNRFVENDQLNIAAPLMQNRIRFPNSLARTSLAVCRQKQRF
jgi:hypothetical protein